MKIFYDMFADNDYEKTRHKRADRHDISVSGGWALSVRSRIDLGVIEVKNSAKEKTKLYVYQCCNDHVTFYGEG